MITLFFSGLKKKSRVCLTTIRGISNLSWLLIPRVVANHELLLIPRVIANPRVVAISARGCEESSWNGVCIYIWYMY